MTKAEIAQLRDDFSFCKPRHIPRDYVRYFCGRSYWEQQYCVWKIALEGKRRNVTGWKAVRAIWDNHLVTDSVFATPAQRRVIFTYAKKLARHLLRKKKS